MDPNDTRLVALLAGVMSRSVGVCSPGNQTTEVSLAVSQAEATGETTERGPLLVVPNGDWSNVYVRVGSVRK